MFAGLFTSFVNFLFKWNRQKLSRFQISYKILSYCRIIRPYVGSSGPGKAERSDIRPDHLGLTFLLPSFSGNFLPVLFTPPLGLVPILSSVKYLQLQQEDQHPRRCGLTYRYHDFTIQLVWNNIIEVQQTWCQVCLCTFSTCLCRYVENEGKIWSRVLLAGDQSGGTACLPKITRPGAACFPEIQRSQVQEAPCFPEIASPGACLPAGSSTRRSTCRR